jgi:hypothetical protein
MMSAGDFKPGSDPRRNLQQTFKPGNPHRWPPGVSGNAGGKTRGRRQFEQAFFNELMCQGSPGEAAKLLWECARAKEPWAVQLLLQRLAPMETKLKMEVARGEDDDGFDPGRLSDAQLEQLTRLLELASGEARAIESGESPAPSAAVHSADEA